MAVRTSITYVCDWCAIESAPVSDEREPRWPEGWAQPSCCVYCSSDGPLLCRVCVEERALALAVVEEARRKRASV